MQLLKESIQYAIDDILVISRNTPNEVKPKEGQICSAIYSYFKKSGHIAHIEATYPNKNTECDLRLCETGQQDTWVEVKTVWGATGWQNKPNEQIAFLENDWKKLNQDAPKNARKALVVFGFFDRIPVENCGLSLPKKIEQFHPKHQIAKAEGILIRKLKITM